MKYDRIKQILTILVVVSLAAYLGWRLWDRYQNPARSVNVPSKEAFDKVKEGMTIAEVEAILGPPANTVVKEDMPEEVRAAMKEDVWYWGGRRVAGKTIRVYFKDGKVSRTESEGI